MTTAGAVLINAILPEDIKVSGTLDVKEIRALLSKVAQKYPDKFPEISLKLGNLGADFAYRHPKSSFSWEELAPTYELDNLRKDLYSKVREIISDSTADWDKKSSKIIDIVSKYDDLFLEKTKEILKQRGGALYGQSSSGTRGKPVDIRRLITGDILYIDHKNRPIPVPVLRGYSMGLRPSEYWLATFGARKGFVTTNLGTADAGYLSKQLTNAAHRLIVTAVDYKDKNPLPIGLPVDTSDPDNAGSFLAVDVGGYKRNTLLTPEILADLKNRGFNQILVRSVLTKRLPGGGVTAKDVGLMENGRMLSPGDMIGIIASQSLGEPVTQMVIGAKHSGGTSKTKVDIGSLILALQVPKQYRGAVHTDNAGTVKNITDASAGGKIVTIDNEQYYVPPQEEVNVKIGDFVEAGDPISSGIPNISKLVQHKGIGEGRRKYVELLRDIYKQTGFNIIRRNFEILVSGLIDHVKLTQPIGNYIPGDVVSYTWLESKWTPREGSKWVSVDKTAGKYLELPVLHYTIGTAIAPSMVKILKQFNIDNVLVHDDPPPFEPYMVPAAKVIDYDPDWLVRFLGGTFGQKRSLIKAVSEGHKSEIFSTSYVPPFVTGKAFATEWPKKILQS